MGSTFDKLPFYTYLVLAKGPLSLCLNVGSHLLLHFLLADDDFLLELVE